MTNILCEINALLLQLVHLKTCYLICAFSSHLLLCRVYTCVCVYLFAKVCSSALLSPHQLLGVSSDLLVPAAPLLLLTQLQLLPLLHLLVVCLLHTPQLLLPPQQICERERGKNVRNSMLRVTK